MYSWPEDCFDTLMPTSAYSIGPEPLFLKTLKAGNYFESGALVHLLPDWIFGRYTVYLALPTRKLMPARIRAFLDFASELVPSPDKL